MVRWFTRQSYGPIGIDLGSCSVKLVQFSADGQQLVEASRWDLPNPPPSDDAERVHIWADAIQHAYEGRHFRGRDCAICLGGRQLYVQNLRVPKPSGDELEQVVRHESLERIPFPADETDLRFVEASDIRQGDVIRREVIVLACHRPVLEQMLEAVEQAQMRPVAVDVEPIALVRCYRAQLRRDEDRAQRLLFVHIGASSTAVIIAQGGNILFVKYIDVGGRQFDDAVARQFRLAVNDAWSLRRHSGDRRSTQKDPEVARGIAQSIRPVLDRLIHEVSMCVRYHSVTFRGQPLARMVLGGGEATSELLDVLSAQIDLPCELGEPLRSFDGAAPTGRSPQWDVAVGLAMKSVG